MTNKKMWCEVCQTFTVHGNYGCEPCFKKWLKELKGEERKDKK